MMTRRHTVLTFAVPCQMPSHTPDTAAHGVTHTCTTTATPAVPHSDCCLSFRTALPWDKAHGWPWSEERGRFALWITPCQSGWSASTPSPDLSGNTTKPWSRLALLCLMLPLECIKTALSEPPPSFFYSNIIFLRAVGDRHFRGS